jgi:peptide/nickel transport system permease protein
MLSTRGSGWIASESALVEGVLTAAAAVRLPPGLRRVLDSDLWWSFRRSPVTVIAAVVALMIIGGALFATWIAPHDPWDPASLSLLDASNPPAWLDGGSWTYPLGTDNQGRDVLSAILYGSRLSLFVGSLDGSWGCSSVPAAENQNL